MGQVSEVTKALGGMPPNALAVLIILAAFGLAAFSIYAVMTISRSRRSGD